MPAMVPEPLSASCNTRQFAGINGRYSGPARRSAEGTCPCRPQEGATPLRPITLDGDVSYRWNSDCPGALQRPSTHCLTPPLPARTGRIGRVDRVVEHVPSAACAFGLVHGSVRVS